MSLVEHAPVNEVSKGTMKSSLVGGKVVCGSSIDGKLYTINNVCTHVGGELSKGGLEGKVVTCLNRGARLDVTTGKCIAGPQIDLPRGNAKDETVFEVEIQDNKSKIAMV